MHLKKTNQNQEETITRLKSEIAQLRSEYDNVDKARPSDVDIDSHLVQREGAQLWLAVKTEPHLFKTQVLATVEKKAEWDYNRPGKPRLNEWKRYYAGQLLSGVNKIATRALMLTVIKGHDPGYNTELRNENSGISEHALLSVGRNHLRRIS